jgi:hypothetical protein
VTRASLGLALAVALTACGGAQEPTAVAQPSAEPTAAAAKVWQPRPGTSWQIQLQGTIDTTVKARVFEIDGLDNSAGLVRRLQAKGRKVVCYFSAGTYESFRDDRDTIPAETRGKTLADFPDEQWLDIRALDKLRPMIESRLETCRSKGFDAVDFDNVDGYANDTGFPLTAADQLRFNRFLAARAHAAGLAAGLKNDLGQIPQLVRDFEFSVNEQCFQYRECDRLLPFIRRDKAVFHIEYRVKPSRYCARAQRMRFSSVYKKLSLKAFRIAC